MFVGKDILSSFDSLFQNALKEDNNSLIETFGDENSDIIYGEASKTIPGVLRYFVSHIETLLNILITGNILVSEGESDPDTQKGQRNVKRPFVSFSHQLFSHAYRSPSKWKYGITVDEEKLRKEVEKISGANIKDNFKHQGKTMYVYGAFKQSDGAEFIVTSFGKFEINLSDTQNIELGRTHKENYFEKIKSIFYDYIQDMKNQKSQNPTATLTAESFKVTEDPKEIQKILDTPVTITSGFLLLDRRPSTGLHFPKLYNKISGLFDYLQDNTTLNEGEFRVWLPDRLKFFNIKNCINGIVLPSNYVDENLNNLKNKSQDILALRNIIQKENLKIYIYNSGDTSNIPDLNLKRRKFYKLEKPSLPEYFHEITSSYENVVNFIKDIVSKYKTHNNGMYMDVFYHTAIATATSSLGAKEVAKDVSYNYQAFLKAIEKYGLNSKDLRSIYLTGAPLLNAHTAFEDITKDKDSILNFLRKLAEEYSNVKLSEAYRLWFTSNTNYITRDPEFKGVEYLSFTEICNKKFNYTSKDLNKIFRGDEINNDRLPLNKLFQKIAKTSKKSTIEYIEKLAKRFPKRNLAQAYENGVEEYSTYGTGTIPLEYNYSSWLHDISDPNGNVKLSEREVKEIFTNSKIT